VTTAATFLKEKLIGASPRVAIVLGSSLGQVTDAVENPVAVPFAMIPGFPMTGVSGHAGVVVLGTIGPNEVLLISGRTHAYEHGNAAAMRPIIEAISDLGISWLILINAAGSIRPEVRPGCLMLITDHINFSGMNPLIGEIGDVRFVPMTNAYDRAFADRIRDAARIEGIDLAEGTYIWFSGPSFETSAEIKAARTIGADVVGMSTVPEVILARRFGVKVSAISLITNLAEGVEGSSPSHNDTQREASQAAPLLIRLLEAVLRNRI
jgi:purine-nucleoside phosphorylase